MRPSVILEQEGLILFTTAGHSAASLGCRRLEPLPHYQTVNITHLRRISGYGMAQKVKIYLPIHILGFFMYRTAADFHPQRQAFNRTSKLEQTAEREHR